MTAASSDAGPMAALRCRECGKESELDARYVCECFGPLEVAYTERRDDPSLLRRRIESGPPTIWRYADFLPVTEPPERGLPVGRTPLIRADRLAERLGLSELWIKNDTANPTHSFKDRVVAVATARAQELELESLACASTGNLAGAVAAVAANLGLPAYVFIPTNLEEEKILAAGVCGANLVRVRGTYDDVNRLCTQIADEHEWAVVNVNLRPYYAEGSKTLAFETVEQLGWRMPEHVVCPIASGSLFTKVARGFQEWISAGLVDGELPRFHGAQAAGCAPVARAFDSGSDTCLPVRPQTIAKSLAIGNPADGPFAVELARNSGGTISAVDDDAIRAGVKLLAETTGIFAEAAGGVTVAVLASLAERGALPSDEPVVAYITGDGLKTIGVARGAFTAVEVDANLSAFEEAVLRPVAV